MGRLAAPSGAHVEGLIRSVTKNSPALSAPKRMRSPGSAPKASRMAAISDSLKNLVMGDCHSSSLILIQAMPLAPKRAA